MEAKFKNYKRMSRDDLIKSLEFLQQELKRKGFAKDETMALLHNLQVHQIELEMQNRELQESQQQLEEARNRYAELYDFAPIGYMSLDERGVILEINLTGAAMLGQERSRLAGYPFMNFVAEAERKIFYEHLRRSRQTRERSYEIIRLVKKSGERMQTEFQSVAVHDDITGETVIRTAIIDITERRVAEQRLQELAIATEQSPGMVVVGSIGGVIEYVNPRFTEITGYDSREVIGKSFSILQSPMHRGEFYQQLWNVVSAGKIWRGDICSKKKDGGSFCQLASIIPLRVFDTRVTHFTYVEIDDTERRRAEAALAEEKERLSVILQSIGEGVVTLDNEGRAFFINREGERITGWLQQEIAGKPLSEIIHLVRERDRISYDDPAEVFLQMRENIRAFEKLVLIDRNGQEKTIAGDMELIKDKDGRVLGMVLVFRDITEQSKIADELLKLQKLESVAVLSGGLAVEFNKLLNLIKGNIELAGDSTPPGDARERLREAEKIIKMTRDLSHQLLTFSTGAEPVKEPVYVDRILKDLMGLILADPAITSETLMQKDLWFVEADEEQIGQVFRNVLLNAVQSMPGGGKVLVRCENVAPEESLKSRLPKGRYVRITIRDNGGGIPKEHLPKIFDPFFTTKERGRGLGLAIAYSIIKKHDGTITVESAPGHGTTICIYLPAS